MAGSQGTTPIFVNVPNIRSNTQLAVNTTKDLSSGTVPDPCFRSNTINGSYLDHIRAKPLGTNVPSVGRVFFNNGGITTQANNNMMITEITLPTITISEVAAQIDIVIPIKIALPPAWNVHVTLGTAVAAGWCFTGVGADY